MGSYRLPLVEMATVGPLFFSVAANLFAIPRRCKVHSFCAGERSSFANRIKAMNRLKAKLLVLAMDQGVSEPNRIKRDAVVNEWNLETRRYMFHPQKLVQDMRTGIQLPDINSVLDGNIEPLIRAHVSLRQGKEMGR